MDDRDLEFSVVSGSNEEMLFGCLNSLHETLKTTRFSWSVTVTCNESGTGLAGRIRARYSDANVIQNDKPLGFAASHNRVLRSSHARYVWLLSDELVILPAAIQRITDYMDKPANSRVGIVSPQLLNPDGSQQPSTYSFPSMPQILIAHSGIQARGAGEETSSRTGLRSNASSPRFEPGRRAAEVDTVRGVCIAVRMKAARQVGEMAEDATIGGEETQWHRRFKDQGWKVIYFPEASAIHYGSATVRPESKNLYPEYLRAALYFFKSGRSSAIYPVFCVTLVGMFGVRAAFSWASRDKSGVKAARRNAKVAWNALRN